jgi:RNA polymerase sigma-70 factor (ECF subfamily)
MYTRFEPPRYTHIRLGGACVTDMWILWAVVGLAGSAAADQNAVERIARGEHDALGELYDRHGRVIYSLALRVVRDQGDAEDVVQDVFAQAWKQAARFDARRGNVIAWLLTMTRTRAIDRVRGRNSRPAAAADETALLDLPDRTQPADEQLAWAGRAAQIRAAFEALPLLQRMAIELAFYEGLTHSEIAERLELPLGTVKTRIRQGLLKMKDLL